MSTAEAKVDDTEDLEALFDSLRVTAAPTPAPKAAAEPVKAAKPKVAKAAKAAASADKADATDDGSGDMVNKIGNLTRMLHDALHQLGYDQKLNEAAAAFPDARDRLAYVAKMTEQAAMKALNATEAAQPLQDKMGSDASKLSAQWGKLFDKKLTVDEFKSLVQNTRALLDDIPTQTSKTNTLLLEIMMAQDFQDLTGQVIKRITELAHTMETQLVNLLVEMIPDEQRAHLDTGLLNGPVVNATGRTDIVNGQNQVDDLLESLGF